MCCLNLSHSASLRGDKLQFQFYSVEIKKIKTIDAKQRLCHTSPYQLRQFCLIVLKSIPMLTIPLLPTVGDPNQDHTRLITCGDNKIMTLTWVQVWFWCIRLGGPCGRSWSPPHRGSHLARWLVPRGQTASCPGRCRCSSAHRGRSGRTRSPSRCWWQAAAGRGRRSPHFPCEGFLWRERNAINTLKAVITVTDGILHEHTIFPPKNSWDYFTWWIFCIFFVLSEPHSAAF